MSSTIVSSSQRQRVDQKPSQNRRSDSSQDLARPLREPGKGKRKKEGVSTDPHKLKKDNPREEENPSGSPWDQIERKAIRLEDLGLDQAHEALPEAALGPPPVKRPSRRERWQHTGREPITDIADLPKGWDMTEPDLDPKYVICSWNACNKTANLPKGHQWTN